MKFLPLILTYLLLAASLSAQDSPAAFKKQVKAFTKSAQGLYEVRPEGENIPEARRQNQDLLLLPLSHWNTETEAWFCFIWLSPKFKDKPLEQVFIRVTYKNGQEMNAVFYSIPNNAPSGLSQEWKKSKPYSPMTADFVTAESSACQGFIAIDANGLYRMEAYEPCPRDTKGAGYTAIQVNSYFYGKSCSSGTKFIAPDGKVLMQHNHEFQSKKTSYSLKKY